MEQKNYWIKFIFAFLFFDFLPIIIFCLLTIVILASIKLSQNASLYEYAMVIPIISK